MRNKIFISHATPDDNDFTKWLALKLISLGYEVWCDILFLDKGSDFWNQIENEIRNYTLKFLIVSSKAGNNREGVLNELAVATKVKKQLKDDTFIIPLAIDDKLSYDDINIEIVRLNAINFKKSWAIGLKGLLEAFEKENIYKNLPDPSKANSLYQQIFLYDKGVVEKEETYDSNWFSIISYPEELRFHKYDWRLPKQFDVNDLQFPAIRFKEYLCTFAWEYDFMDLLPKTEAYIGKETIRIATTEILSGEYDTDFIPNYVCKRLVVQMINKAFELQMMKKQVREYHMSNRKAYWIEKDKLQKDKFEKILMIGKQKDRFWHFGVSGTAKLYPLPVLVVSSHIFFTQDGKELIPSKSVQHSSRRRQGRNWWNNKWREKLLAFVRYISDGDNFFSLEVGSEETIKVSNESLKFIGKMSYMEPTKNNLEEESELADMNDFEDEIDLSEEIEDAE